MCKLFFFQAEDGIRDLVRSRGLGDVYKRQTDDPHFLNINENDLPEQYRPLLRRLQKAVADPIAVSYTHLTLPTSDLV